MKNICSLNRFNFGGLLLLVLFLVPGTASVHAQDWITYSSSKFDLQFMIPDYWKTTVNGDMLVSEGDGIIFVLTAVKDESLSTLELFEIQVETLDMEVEGEYEEIDLTGGIQAVLGAGAAIIEGEAGGIVLLAATLDENNYLAYIYAEPDVYEEYEDVMVDIITSLEPYGWDGGY